MIQKNNHMELEEMGSRVMTTSYKEEEEEEDYVPLPGFRFHPTDEELVGFYLRRKVEKRPISMELIKQADIYKFDPWDLPKSSINEGDKEWYFFFKRGRRYRNSIRPNRWNRTTIHDPLSSHSFIDQYHETRAGSTRYRSIQSLVDRFIEKNINTIGDDQVKHDQYGMPRLRAFITLKFFQMANKSGLMLVMDDTNIIDMLKHFEEPLLRDCIQEIQKGPIQKELIKTFAQPESVEEKLDRSIKMSLDGANQGAAVVVGYVLSSSKSRLVLYVMIFALLMGISCSMLAYFLRKHKSVSKVLTKLGIMGTASSVILSFAALIPKMILSCTFGTIAILLLAFMLMIN